MRNILEKLAEREDLSESEARSALQHIADGNANEAETAAFLFGMRAKGETVEEMAAFVDVMRKASIQVEVDTTGAIDVCGTGGDHSGTFNISTAVMFVAAGAGIPVLKHGNRSISSRSGSVDVLETLGAVPNLHKKDVEICFRETGMAFMFAPFFHPAMKHVVPVRSSLKMRTFFNLMGPMINPAGVSRQVIGTYNTTAAKMTAAVMCHLGADHVFTVHSDAGLDELTVSAPSTVYEVAGGILKGPHRVDANHLGLDASHPDTIKGGDAAENASIIRDILGGKRQDGARDIVVLNAAYAILVSGAEKQPQDALARARESIDSGAAAQKLHHFSTCTCDLKSGEKIP